MKKLLIIILFLLQFTASAKVVRYELTASKGKINLSGKTEVDFALMLNGGVPSPTLEFTEGDEAEIKVINNIPDDELSIHWHGLLLDPYMDGVPYVNTPPIFPGKSFTFKFKLRQHGTYWYHSHTNVQEQKGVYGGIVIHPKEKTISYDKDLVVVLSDWSDENATQILKNLRKDGDYYLYKKDTIRSWGGAIKAKSLKNYLYNEWTRMGGMDFSDVGYDAFLINGKRDSQGLIAHPGEKVRIRIINAAASSYFHVALGDLPMKIISMDGVDLKPTLAREFLIGMAETYDILFEVPENKNYQLKATVQDGTGHASIWIGKGDKVYAPEKPFPNMYALMDHEKHAGYTNHGNHGAASSQVDHSKMDHSKMNNSKMDHSKMDHSKMNNSKMDHSKMDHSKMNNKIINNFDVNEAEALTKTEFPSNIPRHDVKLVLDGDMERYVWHINGRAIHEDRTIMIRENEVVRFTFVNNTMMHHPMHLHGHFFRVLNKFNQNSPMKHTVDVAPHTTKVIEFYTNEPGEWMLHCHNLYHLKTGMARVVKYSSFTPVSEIQKIQKQDPHLHDHWYYYGKTEVASNHAQAYLRGSQTWNQFDARIETANIKGRQFSFNEEWDYEVDLLYRRWIGRYLSLITGGTSFGEEEHAVIGASYLLPLLIETSLFINHDGKFRLDVEKRFQWTKTIFSDIDFTWRPGQEEGAHQSEAEISLMYSPSWSWAAGLMLTNDSLGSGIEIQF